MHQAASSRHGPLALLRYLLAILLLASAEAADAWPDPMADMAHARALQTLWALRQPLRQSPDDPRLIGAAIQAEVNLCLHGVQYLDGMFGPWLERARSHARRLAALRGASAWSSVAQAAPELWVRLVEGRTRSVVDALDALPDGRDSPAARVLRTMATRDARLLGAQPDDARMRYARLYAAFECDDAFWQHLEAPGLEPLASHLVPYAYSTDYPSHNLAVDSLAVLPAVLASPDLDDALAERALLRLATAAGGELPTGLARPQAVQRTVRLLDRHAALKPAVWCEALSLVGELAALPSQEQPGSLADCTAWARDRLLWGLRFAASSAPDRLGFIMAVDARHHDELAVVSLICALAKQDHPYDRLLRLLAQADTRRNSVSDIIRAATLARRQDVDAPAAIVATLAQQLLRSERYGVQLKDIAGCLNDGGHAGEANDLLAAAAAADPWSVDKEHELITWTGRRPLIRPVDEPTARWVDAVVDCTQTPWPNLKETRFFSVLWTGKLRVPADGDYGIGFESDDDGHLNIAGIHIASPGDKRKLTLRGTTVRMTAGDHPIEARLGQYVGAAGFRLLWKPPGESDWRVIPGEALLHGDGQPGLEAAGYRSQWTACQLTETPTADELQSARSCPWLKIARLACYRSWMREDYATARAMLTVLRQTHGESYLMDAQLGIELESNDADLALVRRLMAREECNVVSYCVYMPGNGIDATRWANIMNRIEGWGVHKEAFAALPRSTTNDAAKGYLGMHVALSCGDLQAAAKYARDILGEKAMYGNDAMCLRINLETPILLRAVEGREPDWRLFRKRYAAYIPRFNHRPIHDALYEAASGSMPEAELVRMASSDPIGDLLYYYRGLRRFCAGDYDGAKMDFGRVRAHEEWPEAWTSRNLLAWMAQADASAFAKLPKAPPDPPLPDAPEGAKTDF